RRRCAHGGRGARRRPAFEFDGLDRVRARLRPRGRGRLHRVRTRAAWPGSTGRTRGRSRSATRPNACWPATSRTPRWRRSATSRTGGRPASRQGSAPDHPKAWHAIAFVFARAVFLIDIVYGEEAFAEDEGLGLRPTAIPD